MVAGFGGNGGNWLGTVCGHEGGAFPVGTGVDGRLLPRVGQLGDFWRGAVVAGDEEETAGDVCAGKGFATTGIDGQSMAIRRGRARTRLCSFCL